MLPVPCVDGIPSLLLWWLLLHLFRSACLRMNLRDKRPLLFYSRFLNNFKNDTGIGFGWYSFSLSEYLCECYLREILFDQFGGSFLIFIRGYCQHHTFALQCIQYIGYTRIGLAKVCIVYIIIRYKQRTYFQNIRFTAFIFR